MRTKARSSQNVPSSQPQSECDLVYMSMLDLDYLLQLAGRKIICFPQRSWAVVVLAGGVVRGRSPGGDVGRIFGGSRLKPPYWITEPQRLRLE